METAYSGHGGQKEANAEMAGRPSSGDYTIPAYKMTLNLQRETWAEKALSLVLFIGFVVGIIALF
jgi:hypothetical protein